MGSKRTATVLQHFKNVFFLLFSGFTVLFLISSFPFLLFFLFEIRNMSNICGQESKEKCLDKLTPSAMKHEKF